MSSSWLLERPYRSLKPSPGGDTGFASQLPPKTNTPFAVSGITSRLRPDSASRPGMSSGATFFSTGAAMNAAGSSGS